MVTHSTIVEEKLISVFPEIDDEIKSYVLSIILQNSADFLSKQDVYDAIGDVLLSVACDESQLHNEENVWQLCTDLLELLAGPKNKNTHKKLLDAPIHFEEADLDAHDFNFGSHNKPIDNLWTMGRAGGALSEADAKKLEKVEAKLKLKQDKKVQDAITNVPSSSSLNGERSIATVNQPTCKKDAKLESNSKDIKLENFDVFFGDRKLLIDANLTLGSGRRYGLVGRNGLGKTTLLKLISIGSLKIPSKISVLHVEQEVNGDDTCVIDSVLECDEKRQSLLKLEREIQSHINQAPEQSTDKHEKLPADQLSEIYEQLTLIEADKAPARAACILHGLGFNSDDQKRPTKEFSGGWRMRLALARALFLQPDLLLLDEPTNMLDMKAIYWLEDYLQRSWKNTLLVVSHDRNFLNQISTDVIFLYSQRLEHYAGNYDNFEKAKEEKLKNELREFEAQKQFREHVQVFIDRFRYNANRAAQVQSRIKMLEKLPPLKPVDTDADVIFKFDVCEKLNPPVLQMEEISFKYPTGELIFDNCILNADMESRICIVGENGAGKTTLLKLLYGDLEPTLGYRKAHRNLKMAYFTQHHVDQLSMDQNPVQLMQSRFPGSPVEFYRGALGRFGITGDLALQSIASLSGGQKSRLALAILCMKSPNFLILDEPTNHLDIESVEALGKAITEFTGGVVLVSHDERLIELVCKELWIAKNRSVRRLEGGLKEYKIIIEKELAEQN